MIFVGVLGRSKIVGVVYDNFRSDLVCCALTQLSKKMKNYDYNWKDRTCIF